MTSTVAVRSGSAPLQEPRARYKSVFLLLRVLEPKRPARIQMEHFASMKARPKTLRH